MNTLSDIPDVCREIRVSPVIYAQLLNDTYVKQVFGPPMICGITLRKMQYYKPEMWSEHFRSKTVFHFGDGKEVVMPEM
jgi:hypothetical protein